MTEGISIWFWVGFNVFVLAMLALDLGVFHRKAHEVRFKEAIGWSLFWIALALVFNGLLWLFWHRMQPNSPYTNGEAALSFLTGYLIEKSLSVDNLFVILLIFSYFAVPALYQHKVLFWGILGALVLRAVFIFAGVALIERFSWMVLVFGGFLILTGIKMAFQKDKKLEPDKNPVLRLFKRFVPVTAEYHGGKFFTRIDGRVWATPLFVALLFVEMTDIVFAVDSIPAILAVTREPFLVYTANVFAILGLRSLYFALAGIMKMFHYLHYGLSVILVFVGGKMLYTHLTGDKVDTTLSLGVIAGTMALSVMASLLWPKKDAHGEPASSPPLPSGASYLACSVPARNSSKTGYRLCPFSSGTRCPASGNVMVRALVNTEPQRARSFVVKNRSRSPHRIRAGVSLILARCCHNSSSQRPEFRSSRPKIQVGLRESRVGKACVYCAWTAGGRLFGSATACFSSTRAEKFIRR